MTIYQAPDHTPYSVPQSRRMVFLAGSIEMGTAVDWQQETAELLSHAGYIALNPRRDDWDSSWVQSIENENFLEQVVWEFEGLEQAEAVLVHIDPKTKSPITLLELGLLSQLKPEATFISCPMGFWRRGNVQILSARYDMVLFETLHEATGAVIAYLNDMNKLRDR